MDAPTAPIWLRPIPAVVTLRRGWIQNYAWEEDGLRWRTSANIPPASQFLSWLYDTEAHYARKFTTPGVGYKRHRTATCDADQPHLITHVETTPGPVADGEVTPKIHAALPTVDLLPQLHLVDTGFLDAELLAVSQATYPIGVLGPARASQQWQARAGTGCAAEAFTIDWEKQQATCPAGNMSSRWSPVNGGQQNPVVKIQCATTDCQSGPHLTQWVRSKKPFPRRTLTVRPQAQHKALQAARKRQETRGLGREYRRRAGSAGTIARSMRTGGARQTVYIGQARAHLGHVLMVAGLNLLRLGEWLLGQERAKTRVAPFSRLIAVGVSL